MGDENDSDYAPHFYQGSQAVSYKTNNTVTNLSAVAVANDSATGKEPLLSHYYQEKSAPGAASNMLSSILHWRAPGTQISTTDILLGVSYIMLNIGFVAFWADPNYNSGLTWGYLSTANSLFVALPATRNSVLVWLFGIPFDKTIMYHRWLGRLVLVEATLHFAYYAPIALTVLRYKYGIVAWVFLVLIFITSISWIRRNHFNFFFFTHFFFAAYYVFGAMHSPKVFFNWAIAATVFYGLDRVIRFFWGAIPSKTVSIETIYGSAVRVVFQKRPCFHNYKVGQYVFVNFPQLGLLEWHPFTLASGPDEEHLEILIKGLGDHTAKLVQRAESKENIWIRVDGPYGKWPFSFARYRVIVLVVGGVGITPAMSLLRHIYHIGRKTEEIDPVLKHVVLVWSCKSEKEYCWYQEIIDQVNARSESGNYPKLHDYLHITNAAAPDSLPNYIRRGRPELQSIFDDVEKLEGNSGDIRAAVIACGPSALVNAAWDETTARTKGAHRFDFHHETFEF